MCSTLPSPERALPSRRPSPTSFSQPAGGSGEGVVAPGAPGVEEHGRADIEQLQRLPVGVEPLLERDQRAGGPGLVAQGITTQAIVAAEQQLFFRIEMRSDGAAHGREEARDARDWRR